MEPPQHDLNLTLTVFFLLEVWWEDRSRDKNYLVALCDSGFWVGGIRDFFWL